MLESVLLWLLSAGSGRLWMGLNCYSPSALVTKEQPTLPNSIM